MKTRLKLGASPSYYGGDSKSGDGVGGDGDGDSGLSAGTTCTSSGMFTGWGSERRPPTPPADHFGFHCPTIFSRNPRSPSYKQKTSDHEPTTPLLLSRIPFYILMACRPLLYPYSTDPLHMHFIGLSSIHTYREPTSTLTNKTPFFTREGPTPTKCGRTKRTEKI